MFNMNMSSPYVIIGFAMLTIGITILVVGLILSIRWDLVGLMNELSGRKKQKAIEDMIRSGKGVLSGDSALFHQFVARAQQTTAELPKFKVWETESRNAEEFSKDKKDATEKHKKVDLGEEIGEASILTGVLDDVKPLELPEDIKQTKTGGESDLSQIIKKAEKGDLTEDKNIETSVPEKEEGKEGREKESPLGVVKYKEPQFPESDIETGVLEEVKREEDESNIETGVLEGTDESQIETGVLDEVKGGVDESQIETGVLDGVNNHDDTEPVNVSEDESNIETGVLASAEVSDKEEDESKIETEILSQVTEINSDEDESNIETGILDGVKEVEDESNIETGVLTPVLEEDEANIETGVLTPVTENSSEENESVIETGLLHPEPGEEEESNIETGVLEQVDGGTEAEAPALGYLVKEFSSL